MAKKSENDKLINPIKYGLIGAVIRFDKKEGFPINNQVQYIQNEPIFSRDNYILNNYYYAIENDYSFTLEEDELQKKIYIGELLEVVRQECANYIQGPKGIRKYKAGVREFKQEYEVMGLTTKQVSIYRKYYKLYRIVGSEYFEYINENIKERAVCLFTKKDLDDNFIREVFGDYVRGEIKSLSKVEELIYNRPDSFNNKKEQLDSLFTMIKNGFTKRSYEEQEDLIKDIYKLMKGKKSKKCKL